MRAIPSPTRILLPVLVAASTAAGAATDAVNVRALDGQCGIAYPHESMRAGESGKVKLHIEIDADGIVTSTRLLSSSGFARLDDATRSQVEACRYNPPRNAAGASTTASLDVDFDWKLDPSPVPPPGAITERMIRAEYDRVRATVPKEEYRVRHVLTDTREQAEAALQRVRAGESWAVVAHETSMDTGSKEKGGDLGWTAARVFTPHFAEAVERIAPRGLVPEPVKTEFGWHVIEVTATRDAPFPTYDEVRDKIAISLAKKQAH